MDRLCGSGSRWIRVDDILHGLYWNYTKKNDKSQYWTNLFLSKFLFFFGKPPIFFPNEPPAAPEIPSSAGCGR